MPLLFTMCQAREDVEEALAGCALLKAHLCLTSARCSTPLEPAGPPTATLPAVSNAPAGIASLSHIQLAVSLACLNWPLMVAAQLA
jgi:hypothetical protein